MTGQRWQSKIKFTEVQILKREDVTSELLLLWVQKPDDFNFKAGQYCTIGLDGIERAYSIASAPHEKYLELFVELVPSPEGVLTPELWKLDVGDSVTIRPRAKGVFTFNSAFRHQLLVSTVTGIVPYVSFLREYFREDLIGHQFYVLQGASYHDEFVYDKELTRLANQHPDTICYLPTVSRSTEERNKGWTGITGRVNLVVEGYVEEFELSAENTLIYACGHPGMIEDIKTRMIPKGFQICEERFWK